MVIRIAVAGKGGTGKTTFSTLLTRELVKLNQTPILCIDADPNSNLSEHLGMNHDTTIADVREEIRDEKKLPSGMSKPEYVNYRLSQSLAESEGIDLLVIGRPEGRGCYCYVNELLRNFLSSLDKNYKYVIMDNEAGMEHLSRRTTDNVDILYIITNADQVSINSGKKIYKTAEELKLNINKIYFVVNRVTNQFNPAIIENEFNKNSVVIAGMIPEINEVRDIVPIPKNTPVNSDIQKIIEKTIVAYESKLSRYTNGSM